MCSKHGSGWPIRFDKEPDLVTFVPRFKQDVSALFVLMSHEFPPSVFVRGPKIYQALYNFSDASGGGFGNSLQSADPKKGSQIRYGTWACKEEDNSSNWREFTNLVESVEEGNQDGTLDGAILYLFTDNSVSESVYHKGNSSSPLLFDLMLRLKKIEMNGHFKVVLIHISGKRMIAQGTDGLSRGVLSEGIMSGRSMLSFVPLHLDAFKVAPNLLLWIKSWLGPQTTPLCPEDWFELGHDIVGWKKNYDNMNIPVLKKGSFVWAPPPAAADVALEQLRKARLKRQNSWHVFVVPKLYTELWRKHLYRACDIVFEIEANNTVWPASNFEPLVMGICAPFLKCRPWQVRRSPATVEVAGKLQRLRKIGPDAQGNILRKFWSFQRKLSNLPPHLVWSMLQGKS